MYIIREYILGYMIRGICIFQYTKKVWFWKFIFFFPRVQSLPYWLINRGEMNQFSPTAVVLLHLKYENCFLSPEPDAFILSLEE